jgi:hypothetical protein
LISIAWAGIVKRAAVAEKRSRARSFIVPA